MCANLNAEFKRVKNNKQEVVSGGQKVSEVDKKKTRKKLKVRKNTQKETKSEEEHSRKRQSQSILFGSATIYWVIIHEAETEAS